jgi:hypothetical protein
VGFAGLSCVRIVSCRGKKRNALDLHSQEVLCYLGGIFF